jgi:cytoskeletal protein RodZ
MPVTQAKIEPLPPKPLLPQVPPPVTLAAPYVPTPRDLKEMPHIPAGGKPAQHAYKADKWLAGAVVFVVVLVGAIYGVRHLFNANPKPKSAAHASTSTEVKPESTPAAPTSGQPHLVDNPTSNAGKAVAKARDLVAAVEKRDQEQGVESVLSDTPVSPKPTAAITPSATTPPATKPAAVAPTPAPEAELPSLPPSEAFRQFVINMRVNGVFQGENARAMLNGKMYHLGDVVDVKLGITFLKFDVENKQLVFRDMSGAIMTRRF